MTKNTNNNNPFEYMQSFMNNNNMQSMPGIDSTAFMGCIKDANDAITSSSKMAAENMQSIAKKTSESVQKNTTEMYNTMKDAVSAGDVSQISACQNKYLKSTIGNSINNANEMLDLYTKSTKEMLKIFGKTMQECCAKDSK